MTERDCDVCMCPIGTEQVMTECAARHWVCRDCLAHYLGGQIKEHKVRDDELICPVGCAEGRIDPLTVQASVSKEEYAKYLELRLVKEWAKDAAGTAQCPKCSFIIQIDREDDMWKVGCQDARCDVKEFCGKCGERPHRKQSDQDLSCEQFSAWKAEQEDGLRPEAVLKMLSDLKMQICPNCGEAGELESGCKWVMCKCKKPYCYHCGRFLPHREQHHSHWLKGGPYGTSCLGGKKDPKGHVAVCMVRGRETGLICSNCSGWSFGQSDCKSCKGWRA